MVLIVDWMSHYRHIHLIYRWSFDLGIEVDVGWIRFQSTDFRGRRNFKQRPMRRQFCSITRVLLRFPVEMIFTKTRT